MRDGADGAGGAGQARASEHVDVVVVGAGLSGIGAACRLQQLTPDKSFVVLEGREAIGGTWDLFRYPGVRSDSDMFTLGYPFRPWRGAKSIADGASIRDYIVDTATEHGVLAHLRLQTRVERADWSSSEAKWTLHTRVGSSSAGEAQTKTYTCSFLYVCGGYYSYDRPHQPEFPGLDDFTGRVVHPQTWPAELDCHDQEVVVIGSGATAVTLVPALAQQGASVTMLQRTPSYLTALPSVDRVADRLRRRLPARLAHLLLRIRNVTLSQGFYLLARRRPEKAKRLLRQLQRRYLDDPDYLDRHFSPPYEPWDQRLCVTPDGELLKAIARGRVEVVTDQIERFVAAGILLRSGRTLPADVIVSATGLSMLAVGGMTVTVDGEPVDLGQRYAYRGLMLSGVPNLAYCVGYANASWTLRADLVSRYVCRLLGYLDRRGYAYGTPQTPEAMTGHPLLPLNSGYVRRALHRFPQQGDRSPWTVRQNYPLERMILPHANLASDMAFVSRDRVEHPLAQASTVVSR
jgi:monooxygenase